MVGRLYGLGAAEARRRTNDVLERIGLTDAARRRVGTYSGGMRKRLDLAASLVGQPEVVFLDEPTAGLDPAARRDTWQHIRELQAAGVTVVLTTHLLDEAEELADRVAIIDHGRLVALGTPDELTHGSHAELAFTAVPGLDCGSLAQAVEAVVTEPRPGRYVVHADATPARVARLAQWLEDRQVVLGELKAGKRSLEDVFLRLTQEDPPG
jgi:ABC-2 type transport system ATP-binding protein